MTFYTVDAAGNREYFGELQSKEANARAQEIANTTGKVAYRFDNQGGKSAMQPGYEYNAYKSTWARIKGYKAPALARSSEPCGTSHDAGVLRDVLGDICE